MIYFAHSNEDKNTIKIIKSLEDSAILIDGLTETVKHKTKQKNRKWIFSHFVSTFSCFNSATSAFFSSKRYLWKRSKKSKERIYG